MHTLSPDHIATFKEIRRLFMGKDLATVHEGLLRARALSEHLDYLLGGLTVRVGKLTNSIYQRLGRKPNRRSAAVGLTVPMAPGPGQPSHSTAVTRPRLVGT